jgi:glycosyltransferase involved in cell wall biosynthesis
LELAKWNVPSTVINNAIEMTTHPKSRDEFNAHFGVSDDDFVALWPARFSRQKGHDLLLEIFAEIDNPHVKIVCCGDGPLRHDIEQRRDEMGLGERVIIRDFEPGAAAWLAATDYFVVPSRWEGQPLAVLEAANSGVPVVSLIDVEHATARMTTVHHVAALIRLWAQRGEDYRRIREIAAVSVTPHHALGIAVTAYSDLYHSLSK